MAVLSVSSLCELDLHIPVRLRDKVGNNTKWWPLLLHLEPVQIFQNCFFISIFIILPSLPLYPLKLIVINNLLNNLEPLHYLDHHHVELQLCEPPPNAGPGSVFLIKYQILRVTFLTRRFQLFASSEPKTSKFQSGHRVVKKVLNT